MNKREKIEELKKQLADLENEIEKESVYNANGSRTRVLPHARVYFVSATGEVFRAQCQHIIRSDIMLRRGKIFDSREAAEYGEERRMATLRVTNRIMELNREEGWTTDWVNNTQRNYMFVWDHQLSSLKSLSVYGIQDHPNTHYGSRTVMDAVIKEMPEDCKLMLGVE